MAAPHGYGADAGAEFQRGVTQWIAAAPEDIGVGGGRQLGLREDHEAAHADAGGIERIAAEAALGAAVLARIRLYGEGLRVKAGARTLEGVDVRPRPRVAIGGGGFDAVRVRLGADAIDGVSQFGGGRPAVIDQAGPEHGWGILVIGLWNRLGGRGTRGRALGRRMDPGAAADAVRTYLCVQTTEGCRDPQQRQDKAKNWPRAGHRRPLSRGNADERASKFHNHGLWLGVSVLKFGC